MKLLITGGCGFVGSNLARNILRKYPGYSVTVFDNLSRRGSELNIPDLNDRGVRFIHGDIRNREDLFSLPHFDLIIEASAEPSVMAGLDGRRRYLINTNLNGAVNLLELALKNKAVFLFLSTSRVYPINHLEAIRYYETATRFNIADQQILNGITQAGVSESFPIDGFRSLYGASKLSAELIINEYHQFFGLQTIINRCGVIAGPYQMGKVDQGFVVHWIASHFWKKDLSYFGYGGLGKQVRDILYIDDLFQLIDYQIHHIEKMNGLTFNAGGGKMVNTSLLELTELCREVTGNYIKIQSVKENRKADIRIYLSDFSKISSISTWTPKTSLHDMVENIFDWIHKNESTLKNILSIPFIQP